MECLQNLAENHLEDREEDVRILTCILWKQFARWEVGRNGSGSRTMAGFGINGADILGSAIRMSFHKLIALKNTSCEETLKATVFIYRLKKKCFVSNNYNNFTFVCAE
jgi:hypothetical protein